MKKVFIYTAFILGLLPVSSSAQTETKGTIITSSNNVLEGTIKDQLQKKGNIVLLSASGDKKTYSPADVSGFTMNGSKYIAYASDFYKEIVTGKKAALYVRVTDNSGKLLYNGAEVVSVSTAEGKSGDYYLQLKNDDKLNWLSKKNFKDELTKLCADCSLVISNIKSGQSDYTQITKLIEQYNNCQ